MFTKDDLIHAYTRRQAIEDHILLDVTEAAKKAGFKYPVAITQEAAWAASIIEPGEDAEQMLRVLRDACRGSSGRGTDDGPELRFLLHIPTACEGVTLSFKAVIGPDDDGSPCITVMLPDED